MVQPLTLARQRVARAPPPGQLQSPDAGFEPLTHFARVCHHLRVASTYFKWSSQLQELNPSLEAQEAMSFVHTLAIVPPLTSPIMSKVHPLTLLCLGSLLSPGSRNAWLSSPNPPRVVWLTPTWELDVPNFLCD